MILYHGSEKIIEIPLFEYKNSRNDFGSGFYCTKEPELAKEWACKKNTDGFANEYEISIEDLKVVNLETEYGLLNWLALLTKYRGYWQRHAIAEEAKAYLQEHFLPDISEADVIVGYRADDSYFSFAQDFVMGAISLRQLADAMRLGTLGEQVVLKSAKAFERIRYIGYEIALAEEYYALKEQRDAKARRAYNENKKNAAPSDIYMLDIIRGRVSEDEIRIR